MRVRQTSIQMLPFGNHKALRKCLESGRFLGWIQQFTHLAMKSPSKILTGMCNTLKTRTEFILLPCSALPGFSVDRTFAWPAESPHNHQSGHSPPNAHHAAPQVFDWSTEPPAGGSFIPSGPTEGSPSYLVEASNSESSLCSFEPDTSDHVTECVPATEHPYLTVVSDPVLPDNPSREDLSSAVNLFPLTLTMPKLGFIAALQNKIWFSIHHGDIFAMRVETWSALSVQASCHTCVELPSICLFKNKNKQNKKQLSQWRCHGRRGVHHDVRGFLFERINQRNGGITQEGVPTCPDKDMLNNL